MEANSVELQKKSDVDFLDGIDSKSKKIFDKIYLVLAFWLILTPFGTSLFSLIGAGLELLTQGMLIAIMFFVVWIIEFSLNITKIRFKR